MARQGRITRALREMARSGCHDTHEWPFLSISGYLADQPEKCETQANYSIFSWFSMSGLIAHQVSEDRCSSPEPGADDVKNLGCYREPHLRAVEDKRPIARRVAAFPRKRHVLGPASGFQYCPTFALLGRLLSMRG